MLKRLGAWSFGPGGGRDEQIQACGGNGRLGCSSWSTRPARSSGLSAAGGTTYPFTMVGTDPAAGQATHVPVEIIPLSLDFAGSGCVLEDSGMAADLEASPLFAPTDLRTGVTQWLDEYQRSNFWSAVSTTSPGYHLLLDPSDIPAVTLHVPASQGIAVFDPTTNRTEGVVSGDWFYNQLLGLLNSLHVSPAGPWRCSSPTTRSSPIRTRTTASVLLTARTSPGSLCGPQQQQSARH
jgi:hypothetical protein